MDNVFSEIKSRLAMPEVTRFYGLEMDRAGVACCPFHNDKTPSLKVYDEHFYCFGCGATGDCTGFAAINFSLPVYLVLCIAGSFVVSGTAICAFGCYRKKSHRKGAKPLPYVNFFGVLPFRSLSRFGG